MLETVFEKLDANKIDSVTLGSFRLPKGFYKTMHKLYPEHWLFSSGLCEADGMVIYRPEIEAQVFEFLEQQCLNYISKERLFSYRSFEVAPS